MTLDLEQVAADSDFITEAIDERLEDKIELFRQLDEMCPPQTIIASNTSSLSPPGAFQRNGSLQ